METGLQKLITSEEDDDEEMEMDVKEEDDGDEEDDEDGEKHVDAAQMMVGVDGEMPTRSNNNNRFQQHHQFQEQVGTPGGGGARRCRPIEEKERTKLRERQRRAITARILAGLRRHGNYNLRVRADINDVIAALAREAGWVVLPDGTTFPSKSQGPRLAGVNSAAVTSSSSQIVSPRTPACLKGVTSGYQSPGELNASNTKGVYLPSLSPYDLPSSARSQGSSIVGDGAGQTESHPLIGGSMDNVGNKQIVDIPLKLQERDFSSTVYIPVYVMLPLGVINMKCDLVDPDGLLKQLRVLKSVSVDGIMVDCWWGIVEGHAPQEYNWNGYKRLFQMVCELKLKLQVYFDCMRSFRVEFDKYFKNGNISMIQVGLGPCGELRYPSCPVKHGWRYPGVGEFQCYDQYLLKSLRKAAEARGHSFWGRGPDNAGSYNSRPNETGFFSDGGDYDGYYGRFFLNWYSRVLVDHGDRVLSLAKLAFDGTCIAAKVSGLHWWYKTASHAAELTAGFYNPCNRDGYSPIATMLKKHEAALSLACTELHMLDQHEDFQEALGDSEGLFWQVLNAAWDVCLPVSSENALACHDRISYNKILDNAKPLTDPDGRHLSSFTYLRLSPLLMERDNFMEFERFVKRMHGEAVVDQVHSKVE